MGGGAWDAWLLEKETLGLLKRVMYVLEKRIEAKKGEKTICLSDGSG